MTKKCYQARKGFGACLLSYFSEKVQSKLQKSASNKVSDSDCDRIGILQKYFMWIQC